MKIGKGRFFLFTLFIIVIHIPYMVVFFLFAVVNGVEFALLEAIILENSGAQSINVN